MSSIKYKYIAEQDGVMLQDIYFASSKEPLFKKGQDVKMQVYDKVVIGRNGKESVVDRVYAVGGIKQDSRFPVPFGKGRFVRLGTEVGFVPPKKTTEKKEGNFDLINKVIKPVVEIDDIKVENLDKEAEKIKHDHFFALNYDSPVNLDKRYNPDKKKRRRFFLLAIIIGATIYYLRKRK